MPSDERQLFFDHLVPRFRVVKSANKSAEFFVLKHNPPILGEPLARPGFFAQWLPE
ncbi:hypothetical protein [Pseudomonas chlororaphis]|uniref:hypothetical protein n=1 Tax=Pseudomonas chlororaphis TaxID=587753 RepID=UPI0013DDCD24|nr:hypothetical protein [Pseudomonas chlororaphis]